MKFMRMVDVWLFSVLFFALGAALAATLLAACLPGPPDAKTIATELEHGQVKQGADDIMRRVDCVELANVTADLLLAADNNRTQSIDPLFRESMYLACERRRAMLLQDAGTSWVTVDAAGLAADAGAPPH